MQSNVKGFGFRGWMLMIYQFLANLSMVVFTNYPMNALSQIYSPKNPQLLSMLFTVSMVVGIVIQLVLSANIGKVKSVKNLSIAIGVAAMVFSAGVMLIKPDLQGGNLVVPWAVCYFMSCLLIIIWCTFVIGVLIGQWFPRRKGTVMGLVTIAFPLGNALLNVFMKLTMGGGMPNPTAGFLPFFIVTCVGILIGIVFITDYPEQCGAYRDNDKSMTPEIANAMMTQEIEDKKHTVWTIGNTFKCPDFWLITLPAGMMLFGSVGMMTQTAGVIGSYGYGADSKEFGLIMLGVAVVAIIGSTLLGLLDTKIGTRKAMMAAFGFMIASGVIGAIRQFPCMVIAMLLLGVFMGASSNFTVSAAVQYWRREDFPSVFARVNPIANLCQAVAPVILVAILSSVGYHADFILVGVMGVVSMIMVAMVKPERIKELDDKYRTAAGKSLDDALVGRK